MEKIQIDGDLDRSWIITLMAEGFDTYQIIKNYEISEENLLDSLDLLDKEVLLQGLNLSEKFIRRAIEIEYLEMQDLQNLSMLTYAELSDSFISDYKEHLNWTKIIIYLSTQTNYFWKYLDIIEEKNLWSLISANDLPIFFIREHKEKLDWKLLSMTKCFNEEEKEEFSDLIVETKRELTDEELKSFGGFNVNLDYEKDFSVDEIADLIDKYMSDNNANFTVNLK